MTTVDRTNTLAVLAMVFGLLSGTVVAIVLGHVALSQIKTTGERGRGMAIAGLVLGYVWFVVAVVIGVVYVVWVVNSANSYSTNY